jgi:hypothetical protein
MEIRGYIYDNHSIIPYNPYLSKCYNIYINIEIYSTVRIFKYLYKYIYKDDDRITIIFGGNDRGGNPNPPVPSENDEISNYIDIRYIGSYETIWRLSQFEI